MLLSLSLTKAQVCRPGVGVRVIGCQTVAAVSNAVDEFTHGEIIIKWKSEKNGRSLKTANSQVCLFLSHLPNQGKIKKCSKSTNQWNRSYNPGSHWISPLVEAAITGHRSLTWAETTPTVCNTYGLTVYHLLAPRVKWLMPTEWNADVESSQWVPFNRG